VGLLNNSVHSMLEVMGSQELWYKR